MAEEEATRELILRLALEDAIERREHVFGKAKAGSELTDEQTALEEHAVELQMALQFMIDAHFAHSISQAIDADAALLRQFEAREQMEMLDRGIAIGLSRPGSVRVSAVPTRVATPQRSGAASPLRQDRRKQMNPTSSSINEACAICMEKIGRQSHLKVPCGHYYDEKCLIDLAQVASKDESSFPPRCCREEIPKDALMGFLTGKARVEFEEAWREYSTKPKDRIYCSNLPCSLFLAATTSVGKMKLIRCESCKRQTCSTCREAEHQGVAQCEPKEDADVVQALLKNEKWQRCPECRRVIELAHGCFHITCICRAQFCYVCAATWKECTCPQWEEQNLLEEARRRVHAAIEIEAENRYYRQPEAPRVREARVQQMASRLRANHACVHDWRKRNGGGNCGHCGDYLALYLMSCQDCYMAVCARCARNRL